MTSIYKENVNELKQLEDQLYVKKGLADALRDQLTDLKTEYDHWNLKWQKLKEEKELKQKKLKAKDNDLIKLKTNFQNKRKYLLEGHELHMKQLKLTNESEINKLNNEYRSRIDQLKFQKIKKFEEQKMELIDKIEGIKNKIATNDDTLRQIYKASDDKYASMKQEWLQNYHEKWIENLELNKSHKTEIENLKMEIERELKPGASKRENELNELKERYDKLSEDLGVQKQQTETLQSDIKAKEDKLLLTRQEKERLESYIIETKESIKSINEELEKEETIRRELHNELQEIRGNIRVYCRIRPPLIGLENNDSSFLKVDNFDDDNGVQCMEITRGHGLSAYHKFKFDRIFDKDAENQEIFDEVGQLVQSSLDGYNVCIFAYGQTGSGKTYTMLHPKDGIIPLTINHIFKWIKKLETYGWEYSISCEFIEIYNETIYDLLRSNSTGDIPKHEIRHDTENKKTSITNVTTCKLDSEDTVNKLLQKASKLRSTASTASNEHSSRSHSIFIIHLDGYNTKTGLRSRGTLNLVDLAGSERINSSQVLGDRLRETQNINKSLSCLGDVIHALGNSDNSKRHIPFRNSKLTYLLQYSLIGHSKTLMFVNISSSSSHINETLNSLRFASKVNSIKMVNR